MNLTEIETNAKALMTAHGLGSIPFRFDGGKRRIGCTRFINVGDRYNPRWLTKEITLSRHFAVLLGDDEIRDVILHEIAHALAGHGEGHGPVWKRIARQVGAVPERCKAASARPEARVTAKCPECGVLAASQHRLPTALYVCKTHKDKPLTWYRDGARLALSEMPAGYQEKVSWASRRGSIK